MRLRSLGYRTDLIFPRYEGEILDRNDYLVVRTPKNPGFYWGNFLLFDHPPTEGDLGRWEELFRREIGGPPETGHLAIGWDSTTGEPGRIVPFIEAGYHREENITLTAERLTPPSRRNGDIHVRPLVSDADWEAALENQIACFLEDYEPVSYREYRTGAMSRYRAMVEAGLGIWYGAFLGDTPVGDLGVFVDETQTLGRFQAVATHPDFRRRGICSTLVATAGQDAQERFGVSQLVIAADPGYHAVRIYESLGFSPTERQIGVCKA